MKVVGIVCSPRKGGNTEILVREALGVIQELGGETELITVSGKTINPCDGCDACVKEGVCRINDDMQEIYQQLLQSDGIILGTPVYFNNVSAQAKAVMDRTYAFLWQRKLRGKVAGAIVVARRVGAGQVRNILYSYLIAQRMLVAGGAIGYGREKGEVKEGVGGTRDTSALEEARNLGRAVVSLHQRLSKWPGQSPGVSKPNEITQDGEILIPAIEDVIKSIDLNKGCIIIEPIEGLLSLNQKVANQL